MNPTPEQINDITIILEKSIKHLIENDGDIFIENSPPDNSRDKRLYENCINHRLAFYLENAIKDSPNFTNYLVDCEYDKLGNKKKQFIGKPTGVRPDIIIHGRGREKALIENYLVIEANIKEPYKDTKKIRDFITDNSFQYLFGFTISYCYYSDCVKGRLFFREQNGEIKRKAKIIEGAKALWRS